MVKRSWRDVARPESGPCSSQPDAQMSFFLPVSFHPGSRWFPAGRSLQLVPYNLTPKHGPDKATGQS